MKQLNWRLIPVFIFLSLVVFLWRGLSLDPHHLPSVQIGRTLPLFRLPELGKPAVIISSKQLQGSVSLLNVWASWCASCIDEQVFMLDLARQGITIYGLNYKDKSKDALEWLTQWGNPYKKIMQDRKGKIAIDLGVYGAPETFILDKQGVIQYRHVGIMNRAVWDKEMLPLIKKLEQS